VARLEVFAPTIKLYPRRVSTEAAFLAADLWKGGQVADFMMVRRLGHA